MTLLILIWIFLVILLMACCKVASDADDAEAEMFAKRMQKDKPEEADEDSTRGDP